MQLKLSAPLGPYRAARGPNRDPVPRANMRSGDKWLTASMQQFLQLQPQLQFLPIDCKIATRLPAATPPPLATAAIDISLAAMEPAAIPPA
ncbi:hypothetical protein F7725_007868, partial [Dissostichus mawsoni]